MESLLELFVHVDDFCLSFLPIFEQHLLASENCLTPGNVDVRKPVSRLLNNLFGKVFGVQGYISPPHREFLLQTFGVQFITKPRSNAKHLLPTPLMERLLLRRRAIIESVIDQFKKSSLGKETFACMPT